MVRLVDVAEAAGVSVATVSRAMNRSPRIDPELGERVRSVADRLGYQPNAVARNLRRQGTQVWALIIPDIANPFYTAVARGVEDAAIRSGYSVLLCNTDEDQEKEDRYLRLAAQERVAGVIFTPRSPSSGTTALSSIGIPVVVVDREMDQPIDFVTADSLHAAAGATQHLLDQGWRRPACLTRPVDTPTAEQRRLGYAQVVARAGLPELVRHAPFHDDGADIVAELFTGLDRPDSLVTIDSMLALGTIIGLRRCGLSVGRDVGLVSFDDPSWATAIEPPVTVVVQPAHQIGVEAARLLAERISGSTSAPARTIVLDTELVVRESSLGGAASPAPAAVAQGSR